MFTIEKNFKIGKYFSIREMACKEGGQVLYDYRLIEKLDQLREILGCPLYINSGYRTPEYNKKIGGSSNSQHMYGKAVDISTKNLDIDDETLIRICANLGFTGIGIYPTWIHLDVRDKLNNTVGRDYDFWDYR